MNCQHTGRLEKYSDGSARCKECERLITPNYNTQIAALRSQLATVTAERGELFNVAVKAFQAVEQMDLKGELSKYSAMQNLDYVCARISKKLWERVDAAALKGGNG